MADLNYLTTFFADWNAAAITGDSWDPGFGPDAFRPWCDVLFTPVLIGQDSQEVSITQQTPKLTLLLIPVPARLENGVLKAVRTPAPAQETPTAAEWEVQDESVGVPLTAETPALELPPGVHLIYRVQFGPMKVQGGTYRYDDFDFAAPTTATRVHLTTVERINLPPSSGNQLVLRMIPDDVTLVDGKVQFWSSGIALGAPLALEVSSGGSGSIEWSNITAKPAVIGAGADQGAARAAIGAVGNTEMTDALAAMAGNLQPADPDLTAIAALPSTANRLPYATGPSAWSLTEFSPFGRSVAALADGPALRVLAGLVIGTNVQAYGTRLNSLSTFLAGLSGAGTRMLSFVPDTETWNSISTLAYGRSLLNTTDAAAARTLLGALAAAAVGAANGVAPLDANALIPATYLPSYVDDVLEYANLAGFPVTGEAGKIYTALNAGTPADPSKIYRWSGSTYVEISPSPGSTDAVPEGAANLYFTNARADARIAASAATGTGNLVRAQSPTFTGTVSGITKSMVGLGNADNTSDANKPVSTAQAAADTAVANASVPKSLIDAKGDLFVGTADNTVARLAVGTNGQVLTADSSQPGGLKWAASAGGSGGGSGFGTYSAMPGPDTVAEGYLYKCSDIDSTYRSTGTAWVQVDCGGGPVIGEPPAVATWTAVNLGTATAANDKGTLLLTAPAVNGTVDTLRALSRPISGNPTIIAKLDFHLTLANGPSASMGFTDGTKFKLWEFQMRGNQTFFLARRNWNTSTALGGGSVDICGGAPAVFLSQCKWWRIVDTGTNHVFSLSTNGLEWQVIDTVSRTDFLTPNAFCVGLNTYGNGYTASMRLRQLSIA